VLKSVDVVYLQEL